MRGGGEGWGGEAIASKRVCFNQEVVVVIFRLSVCYSK